MAFLTRVALAPGETYEQLATRIIAVVSDNTNSMSGMDGGSATLVSQATALSAHTAMHGCLEGQWLWVVAPPSPQNASVNAAPPLPPGPPRS